MVEMTKSNGEVRKEVSMYMKRTAKAQHFLMTDPKAVTLADGRRVIKAGTIYPSNDANAQGVVDYEVDITNGDGEGALIIDGFINKQALPEQPTQEAITVLRKVLFMDGTQLPTEFVFNGMELTISTSGSNYVITAQSIDEVGNNVLGNANLSTQFTKDASNNLEGNFVVNDKELFLHIDSSLVSGGSFTKDTYGTSWYFAKLADHASKLTIDEWYIKLV